LTNESARQNNKPPLEISSEEEFLSLIEEIDREMTAEGVKITARPFVAGLKITGRYNITLDACPPRRPAKQGCFDPLEISIRIHDWIEQRYGNRLKVPFSIGSVVLPLRGALYKINCPTIYGQVKFVCEPNNFGKPREAIGQFAAPVVNVLDLIEDMTPALANSLMAEEVVRIGIASVAGMAIYLTLHAIVDVEYVREALGDFDAAVLHLMEHRPQPGLSKWASLQATEKIVKAYISQSGGKVKYIHSLPDLYSEATNLGLPQPPPGHVDLVQCLAGVRYGQVVVSLDEATRAHVVSLELCEVAARCVGNILKRKLPVIPEPQIDGMPLAQFLRKYSKRDVT